MSAQKETSEVEVAEFGEGLELTAQNNAELNKQKYFKCVETRWSQPKEYSMVKAQSKDVFIYENPLGSNALTSSILVRATSHIK